MKSIIVVGLLLLALAPSAVAAGYRNIMSSEAQNLLAQNKEIFLLDVRTPEEFRQARLKGAVLIPISELELRVQEIPRNRPILIYCAVGSRSNLVAAFLADKGYKNVFNMVDGIVGWYRNGLPILR